MGATSKASASVGPTTELSIVEMGAPSVEPSLGGSVKKSVILGKKARGEFYSDVDHFGRKVIKNVACGQQASPCCRITVGGDLNLCKGFRIPTVLGAILKEESLNKNDPFVRSRPLVLGGVGSNPGPRG